MKIGNICIATGMMLILAALIITGYNLWDNARAGNAANDVLTELVPMIEDVSAVEDKSAVETSHMDTNSAETIVPDTDHDVAGVAIADVEEVEYPDYILNPNMDMPIRTIDGLDYIGVISIPAIERELPVASEWNYSNLKTAPCRYSGSAYLNNMVICAHNYEIHFGLLKSLKNGDAVTFTDMDGNIFNYRVVEIEILSPYSVDEMTTGDWDLTLFTCTIGGKSRVTVRCERIED